MSELGAYSDSTSVVLDVPRLIFALLVALLTGPSSFFAFWMT